MKKHFFEKIYEMSTRKVNFASSKEGDSFSKEVYDVWTKAPPVSPPQPNKRETSLQTAEARSAGFPVSTTPSQDAFFQE